ncbi:DUF4411 family protein [Frigoribacterium sp. SL97]|uniref:DUF4411 family protein n=1 Tax=Frigoribacterium sp. SL97 TaxID=2994664 RepID=UPI002270D6FE|nr:DUF4411 family protein [Frigoribacterium sp. SL97]WAC53245.1 DUF4411 family protein [Frigoribacterium sp. SL97]
MNYTLDSNILIGLVQRYPRDIFPAMWTNIEASVADGESCICEAILREVHRGGDDLHDWAKDLSGFVCPVTDAELITVAQIASVHPGWVQGQLNEADPFVIAHAKAERSVIVTEENRKGPGTEDKNQKIPNIADEHRVQTAKFFDYIRSYGWQF